MPTAPTALELRAELSKMSINEVRELLTKTFSERRFFGDMTNCACGTGESRALCIRIAQATCIVVDPRNSGHEMGEQVRWQHAWISA